MLAVNAFRDDPSVWLIFVVAALLASSSSMQRPSREALMPRTVRHDQIVAANALTSFGMQVGVLVGPAIGGLLVAYVGIGWCFVVDIVGLAVATLLFVAMRPYPHRAETTPPSLAGIGEGLRYALSRRDLLGTYLVDIAAMLLALPVVLFPALAEEVFERPELLGLLYSAETVGALLATALSGWTARVHHHGRAIVIAAAAYGACIGFAGLMPTIWLVMVFFLLAGAADMISAVFRSTVWNQTIPEDMRGRLAGIEMLSYSLGPLGGQVRAGITADLWTVRGAIVSGGFACVGGVTLTALAAARLLVVRRPHRRARRGRAQPPAPSRVRTSSADPAGRPGRAWRPGHRAALRPAPGRRSPRPPRRRRSSRRSPPAPPCTSASRRRRPPARPTGR